MNYALNTYEYAPGDHRQEVRAESGDVWIIYIAMGGAGYALCHLAKGGIWREGADELHRVFDTKEEAEEELNRL